MMPDIWVFNIDPLRAEPAGWKPHRDRPYETPLMPDMSAASINFWIPLTEATPLNGCMYILPRQFDDRSPFPDPDADPDRDGVRIDQLQYVGNVRLSARTQRVHCTHAYPGSLLLCVPIRAIPRC